MPDTTDLEHRLCTVEQDLAALGEALRLHDSAGIERHARDLRAALARAMDSFTRAGHAGQVPPALRARLTHARAQVDVQHQALLRAHVALDDALAVLLPREKPIVYGPLGGPGSAPFSH
jgi:hypothetical protein